MDIIGEREGFEALYTLDIRNMIFRNAIKGLLLTEGLYVTCKHELPESNLPGLLSLILLCAKKKKGKVRAMIP